MQLKDSSLNPGTTTECAYLTGKVHPDGFFTIGVVPARKKRTKDVEYDVNYKNQFIEVERFIRDFRGARYEVQKYFIGDNFEEMRGVTRKGGSGVSLSSATIFTDKNVPISEDAAKGASRNGLKGITALGRRRLQDGCCLLEQMYGIRRLGFGTLTLPALDKESIEIVNKHWAKALDTFFKVLARVYKKRGMSLLVTGSTEVQPQRLENRDEFVLHYHFVYPALDERREFYFTADFIRETWERIIVGILEKYGSVDSVSFKASINLQLVKRSAKNYLSKYISKGKDDCEKFVKAGYGGQLPKKWWNMTKALLNRVKSAIIPINSSICQFILDNTDMLIDEGYLTRCTPSASYTIGTEEFVCGYWGNLTPIGVSNFFCAI